MRYEGKGHLNAYESRFPRGGTQMSGVLMEEQGA